MGKNRECGQYADENFSALAEDYAAQLVASLTGGRPPQLNSDEYFSEDRIEMEKLREWISRVLTSPAKRQICYI